MVAGASKACRHAPVADRRQRQRDSLNDRPLSVLFLCTGNSARSIIAEQLLNHRGRGRFRAHSAGSHPKGRVHPLALDVLRDKQLPIDGLRSKGWDEFAAPGARPLDIVITVCDDAAGEICPVWPGGPLTAHWGIADPASVNGSDAEQRRAFGQAYSALEKRIEALISLPVSSLDRAQLRDSIAAIGRVRDPSQPER